MNVPSELRYTEEHEWVEVSDDIATVGITDYAQGELGDVVYVELPEVGTKVTQADAFGTIEAVKTVSEIYAPVSGEVVEVNVRLEEEPEVINAEPYGDGWMIKVRMENPAELESLLAPGDYRSLVS